MYSYLNQQRRILSYWSLALILASPMPELASSQLNTHFFGYISSFPSDVSESGWINVENFVVLVEDGE
jgi:hypothetical protein